MSEDLEKREVSHVGAWIWGVIAVLYAISPIDILPDVIPVAGWVDDILITVTGGLNLIQSYLKESNEHLARIVKGIKWVLIVLGIIYAISPVDLLPDVIPVAGWVDDILITVTGGLNLIQSYLKESNEHLAKIVKGIKWVLIVLGILIIAIIALVVVGIANLFA